MADAPQITVLFMTIVDWAVRHGAENINTLPGVWQGETDEWTVKLNGHAHDVDDVPAYGYIVTHKTALVGIAVGNATGGCVAGISENDLIAHFLDQMPGVTHG